MELPNWLPSLVGFSVLGLEFRAQGFRVEGFGNLARRFSCYYPPEKQNMETIKQL